MPSIQIKEDEPFDFALRRFKRQCDRAGIIAEARRREFYEKPTWIRKRKMKVAVKNAKRMHRMNSPRNQAKSVNLSFPSLENY